MTEDDVRDLRKLRSFYKEVFDSFRGRAVLADILVDCGYFDEHPDSTKLEVAKRILYKLGVEHGGIGQVDRVVDALVSVANSNDIAKEGQVDDSED